jgi:subtilase family serine protease
MEPLEPRVLLSGSGTAETLWQGVAELPPGSLVYREGLLAGFDGAGETDTCTLQMDAGQVVTVRLTPLEASLQGKAELFAPGGTSLGSASASGPGKTVLLQTVPVAAAGEYSFKFSALAGSGAYEVELALNAAVEAEPFDGLPNDTRAQAQDINASAVAVQGDGDRAAVLGWSGSGADVFAFDLGGGDYVSLMLQAKGGDAPYTSRDFGAGNRPVSVAIGDVNGDGKTDIVAATNDEGGPGAAGVAILLGNGDGTFGLPTVLALDGAAADVALADVDGDTFLDIVTANRGPDSDSDGTVSVLLNDGSGGFGAGLEFGVAGSPRALALGFMDDDGFLDIVTANDGPYGGGGEGQPPGWTHAGVSVLLGDGTGSFGLPRTLKVTSGTPADLALGDLDGDGALDVVMANGGSGYYGSETSISVLLGAGDGTLRAGTRVDVGGKPIGVALGRLNADAALDVVTANGATWGVASDTISVLLGAGDGSFRAPEILTVGQGSPAAVAIADLDGDGRRDIVATDGSQEGYSAYAPFVSVFRGQGDGTFELLGDFAAGVQPIALAVGDIDGTGYLDIVAADGGWQGPPVSTVCVLPGFAPMKLELLRPTGTVLAQGIDDGAAYPDEYINGLAAPAAGTYYARVSGGAPGQAYTLVVAREADLELPGAIRTTQPQDISGSGQVLGNLGTSLGDDTLAVMFEGFEDGSLGAGWATWSSDANGRVQVTGDRGAHGGDNALALYRAAAPYGYTANEATWTVDLSTTPDAVLSFWHSSVNDAADGFTGPFIGHVNADGIAISADGTNWYPVWDAPLATDPEWQSHSIDLAAAASAAGISLASNFRIRFQEYGYSAWSQGHARTWDDVAILSRGDRYAVAVNAGDNLTLTLARPGGGPGEPANDLAAKMELHNQAGALVAADDDLDGSLAAVAGSTGDYTVIVRRISGAGDYTLRVQGATAAVQEHFLVAGTAPPDGALTAGFPAVYRVALTRPVDPSTVDPGDLLVNGSPATGVTISDPFTLDFNIAALHQADGIHNVTIAAGAFSSSAGTAIEAFAGAFDADSVCPTATATGPITEGAEALPGDVTLTVVFSESLDSGVLDIGDVALVDQYGMHHVNSFSTFSYDAPSRTLTLGFADLPERDYTLTLLSSATAFRDSHGNRLDGNRDGLGGDPFLLHFTLSQAAQVLPTPLNSVLPLGSRVYGLPGPDWRLGQAEGLLQGAGDAERFTIDLDAGQSLSVRVDPSGEPTDDMRVEVLDPAGISLGTVTALDGAAALLQLAPVADAGTYSIVVHSLDGAFTCYLQLALNAQIEEEDSDATNNTLADAETLLPDPSGRRYAAVGSVADDADYYAFHLDAGDAATLVLANYFKGRDLDFALLDASGTLLAMGLEPAGGDVAESISGFVAPAAGTYYVRVTAAADPGDWYTLLVTLDGDFDLGAAGAAQRLQTGAGVEGSLDDPRYDLEPDDYAAGTVLNSIVPGLALSVDGEASQVAAIASQYAATGARTFGHGTGDTWTYPNQTLRGVFAAPVARVSIDVVGRADGHGAFLQVYDAQGNQIAFDGTPDNPEGGVPYTLTVVRARADIVSFIVSGAPCGGQDVALDNLVVAIDPADSYLIQFAAGSTVALATTTPGAGAGEPLNALDPRIEVFAQDGSPVADDDDGAPDGRNAVLSFLADGGIYTARVTGVGRGDYVLGISGAALVNPAPAVTAAVPAHNARRMEMPAFIDFVFSEALRADRLDPAAFTVQGAPATGAALIDARTVRYTFSLPDVEGAYNYALAPGAGFDLQGLPSGAFAGTFHVDKTPPAGVTFTPASPIAAPFNSVTFTFTEFVDPASVSLADVARFTGPAGNLLPQVTGIEASGTHVTVHFNTQAVAGAYELAIGPDILDLAGHAMDQNFNGTPGEIDDAFAASIELLLADLAVVDPVSVPANQRFGETIEVSWTVRNAGGLAATEAWVEAIWLSRNDTLSGDDILLRALPSSAPMPLGLGAEHAETTLITLPLSTALAPGNYWILFQTNAEGDVLESVLDNNVRPEPIALALPPLPDLEVTDIVAPLEALSNQEIPISWTVTNQGDGPATGTWVDYVVLRAADGSGNNVAAGFYFTGTIPAGGSVVRTQTLELPTVIHGEYRVQIATDMLNTIYEHANEGNNLTIDDRAVDVRLRPFPNLRVTDISPPLTANSSQEATVEWTVTNVGGGPTSAARWTDWLYLSDDGILQDPVPAFGSGDYVLGRVPNASYLDSGGSYVNSLTFMVPHGIQGDYHVIVFTDWHDSFGLQDDGSVLELGQPGDEDDNVTASDDTVNVILTPPPDLQVTALSFQTTAFSGQTLPVNWTVTNEGNGATIQEWWHSPQWADRIYLSADDQLDPDDVHLGTRTFSAGSPLGPDGFYTVAGQTVKLPEGISGSYYVIVKADAADWLYEHVYEDNNWTARPITIVLTPPPDLAASGLAVAASGLAGRSLAVDFTVANTGTTATPQNYWSDSVYLSADATLDPGVDILLGGQPHMGRLDAGDSYRCATAFAIPHGLTGDYYVIAAADSADQVFELDNADNVLVSREPIHVTAPMADLVISAAVVPEQAQAGGSFLINFTVANQGDGDTIAARWSCAPFLSADNVFDSQTDLQLTTYQRKGALGAGLSFTAANKLVPIPFDTAPGDCFLFVMTDIANEVRETSNDNNFIGPFPVHISRQTSDLQVTSVNTVASCLSTEPLWVEWTVENLGLAATEADAWADAVYLSTDPVLDATDLHPFPVAHSGALERDGSYAASGLFALPPDLEGNFYVIVSADRQNAIVEDPSEANNYRAADSATTISLGPVPDLAVTNVNAPTDASSGRPFPLSWTVTNAGSDTADDASWFDAVYLSVDQGFDPTNDVYLGYFAHNAKLDGGASYTATEMLNIPVGLAGPFYVYVMTDTTARVHERATRVNNVAYDGLSMLVHLTAPADLVVGDITLPANAVPGQTVKIDYTVENQGANPALGAWYDSLYLSADETWDLADPFVGRLLHTGDVAGPGSYSESLTAPLPGVLPGNYHVILRTDIRGHLRETDETNNVGASLDHVAMDVEALVLGVPDTGTIAAGQSVYYRFEGIAGTTVRLSFDAGNGDSAQELFVRFGQVPTLAAFDLANTEPFVADPSLLVPIDRTGTYYFMAHSTVARPATGYTIGVQDVPFSIQSTDLDAAGNVGYVTLKLTGALFTDETTFALVPHAAAPIPAVRTLVESSTTAYATFSVHGLPEGLYGVRATRPGQPSGSTDLANALTVSEGSGAEVKLDIDGYSRVVYRRTYNFRLDYANTGDVDTMAPLIFVESATGTAIGFSSESLAVGRLQVLGASPDGWADVLRPGALYAVPIWFYVPHSSEDGFDKLNFTARAVTAGDPAPITLSDWDAIEAEVRPGGLSDEQWLPFWSNIRSRIGDTWGHYVRFLNRVALDLSPAGEPFRDVRAMFAALYDADPEFLASSTLSGQLLDAASGQPIAGIAVSAYETASDGGDRASTAVTDAQGRFTLPSLTASRYLLAVEDLMWDMDRDGMRDPAPPAFDIPHNQDVEGAVIYATQYIPAPAHVPSDAEPALAVDAAGVPHILWSRDSAVWHAWHDGTGWVDAKPIADMAAYGLKLETAPNLIGGTGPGLIATWTTEVAERPEVFYAVGRADPTGGYQWAQPVRLTNDAIDDMAPALAIRPDGSAVVVHLKQDATIQDDKDLYYDVLSIDESAFAQVLADLAAAVGELVPASEGNASSFEYRKDWDISAQYVGIQVKAGFAIRGEANAIGCALTAAASGEGFWEMDGPAPGFAVATNGQASGQWGVDKEACEWDFEQANFTVTLSVTYDWKNGLMTCLGAIPQLSPVIAGLNRVIAWVNSLSPLNKMSNGITFNVSLSGSTVWNDEAPFPDWIMPDSGTLSVSVALGPYFKLSYGTSIEATLQGTVKVGIGIIPEWKLNEISGNLTISAKWLGWVFTQNFSVGYFASGLDPLLLPAADQEPQWTYDPAAAVGTGNVYGANSVLANVAGDLWLDGAPALATAADGTVFAAWNKDGNPYAPAIGSQVVVADFNGTTWSTPAAVPGSLGDITDVTAAVDGLGRRVLVWSLADTSSLSPASTTAEIQAARDNGNLVYSIYNNGAWTAPAALAATPHADGAVALERLSDGRLLVTWVTRTDDGGNQLLASFWNGLAWTAPQAVASADAITAPAIAQVAGQPAVFWTQAVATDPEVVAGIFSSAFDGTSWSSPSRFQFTQAGAAATGGEALPPPAPAAAASAQTLGEGTACLFGFWVTEECCKKDEKDPYEPTKRAPMDPNDILGPDGFGDSRWIPASDPIPYTILFENDPDLATAPAQSVRITQKLDPDLDPTTFRLGDFGFGDVFVNVPDNRAFYATRLDLAAAKGIYLDFAAGVDVASGEVFWQFDSIDPATGAAPLDADLGFLPPNVADPEGQGYVTYTIRPRAGAQTGDVIDAQATIFFDVNAPMDTPAIFNTLDVGVPASTLDALPALSDQAAFTVNWAGSDDGSGLRDYTVYVRPGPQCWKPWLAHTTLTEATYVGKPGSTYAFYVVSRDNAGNSQAAPAGPQAQTTVAGSRATIGDYAWDDLDADGLWDSGEPGLANATVRLHTAAGALVGAKTTDSTGGYRFADLDPALQYYLEFAPPAGYRFSPPNQGADDGRDSDPDPATGRTATFLPDGETDLKWDAAFYRPAEIHGVLWNDADGDKTPDAGESGLANWVVFLDANANGQLDEDETDALTDENGGYRFVGLTPGAYLVAEVIPGNWRQTCPGLAGASEPLHAADGGVSGMAAGSNAPVFAPGDVVDAQPGTEALHLIGLDQFRDDPRFGDVDGSGLAAVVIDTGIDLDHPFFGPDADGNGIADRIVYQYDFADGDADAGDALGHGSHVASILASSDTAWPGVAPGVDIIALKVFGDNGQGRFADVERALQWVIQNAVARHIVTVNLSLGDGGNWNSATGQYGIADELAALAAMDVIVVASAGNSFASLGSSQGVQYPAADPNAIAVGAVWDSDRGGPWQFTGLAADYTSGPDRIVSFSQRDGRLLDVFAPGAVITGADAAGGTRAMRGTSQAAAYVSGAAVLGQQIALEQLGRLLTPYEFRGLLKATGQPILDGDDEDDSVANTGLDFRRLDILPLAEAIAALDPLNPDRGPAPGPDEHTGDAVVQPHGQPFTYAVQLISGETQTGVDFGNQAILSASLGNGGPVPENSPAMVGFSDQHDPSAVGSAPAFTYSYDFDNDGGFEVVGAPSPTTVVPATYLKDGPGVRVVRARIAVQDGRFTDYTTTIAILNAPPTVNAGPNAVASVGSPFTGTGWFKDPGSTDGPWTATVDYGDGGGTQMLVLSADKTFALNHPYAAAGTYAIRVRVTDKDGGVGMATRQVTVSAPNLNAVAMVNDGSAQRSMVTGITYTFSTAIDHFDAGAFELRTATGSLIAVTAPANPSGDRKTFVLSFSGSGGSLADGRYTLTLHAGGVHDVNGQTLSGRDGVLKFHRLFGDGDGDGDTDMTDLAVFRSSLNIAANYRAWFDYDGDWDVDPSDYTQFRLRLGKKMTLVG